MRNQVIFSSIQKEKDEGNMEQQSFSQGFLQEKDKRKFQIEEVQDDDDNKSNIFTEKENKVIKNVTQNLDKNKENLKSLEESINFLESSLEIVCQDAQKNNCLKKVQKSIKNTNSRKQKIKSEIGFFQNDINKAMKILNKNHKKKEEYFYYFLLKTQQIAFNYLGQVAICKNADFLQEKFFELVKNIQQNDLRVQSSKKIIKADQLQKKQIVQKKQDPVSQLVNKLSFKQKLLGFFIKISSTVSWRMARWFLGMSLFAVMTAFSGNSLANINVDLNNLVSQHGISQMNFDVYALPECPIQQLAFSQIQNATNLIGTQLQQFPSHKKKSSQQVWKIVVDQQEKIQQLNLHIQQIMSETELLNKDKNQLNQKLLIFSAKNDTSQRISQYRVNYYAKKVKDKDKQILEMEKTKNDQFSILQTLIEEDKNQIFQKNKQIEQLIQQKYTIEESYQNKKIEVQKNQITLKDKEIKKLIQEKKIIEDQFQSINQKNIQQKVELNEKIQQKEKHIQELIKQKQAIEKTKNEQVEIQRNIIIQKDEQIRELIQQRQRIIYRNNGQILYFQNLIDQKNNQIIHKNSLIVQRDNADQHTFKKQMDLLQSVIDADQRTKLQLQKEIEILYNQLQSLKQELYSVQEVGKKCLLKQKLDEQEKYILQKKIQTQNKQIEKFQKKKIENSEAKQCGEEQNQVDKQCH